MAATRFGLAGYGVRRTGSFAGKPLFVAPAVTPRTRFGLAGYGVRRAGSFAGKVHARVVPLVPAVSVELALPILGHVTWISSNLESQVTRERRQLRVPFEERRVLVRGELRTVRVQPDSRSEVSAV